MDGDGRDDGPEVAGLDELARELRAGAGEELRADAEEGERLAAQAALRRRTLADVAREAADRGTPVVVRHGTRRFVGAVARAAKDLLTVVTAGGNVHVNLSAPIVLDVAGPAAAVGRAPTSRTSDDAPGFRARLYELEMVRAEVEVGLAPGPDEVRGRLRAVGRDHVLLDTPDGSRVAVATPAIVYVRVLDSD